MNTEIMHRALAKSLDGSIAFPDVVRTLIEEGVESYRADPYRRGKKVIYFGRNGEFHLEEFPNSKPQKAAYEEARDCHCPFESWTRSPSG
jgi:hypothetical protein